MTQFTRLHRLTCVLGLTVLCTGLSTFGTGRTPPQTAPTLQPYQGNVKVTRLLQTTSDAVGAPLQYPQGTPQVTALLVEFPVGERTGWHRHPVPEAVYVLQGEIEVEFATGLRRTFKAGEAFTEAVNVLHNGRNTGTEPAKLVVFALGSEGTPITVRAGVSDVVPTQAPE